MQTQKPFFDDLARVAGGAMGALSGLKAEFEAVVKQQIERWTSGMDLVPREEFEAVRAMAAKARDEQLALEQRVAALEAHLAAAGTGAKPAAAAKPARPRRAKPAAT
jgi:BMFP domain-containing protein YqiC